jgi:hypothetical protein
MSVYIENPKDGYKRQLVEETIRILKRDYGFQDPTKISGKGQEVYLLPVPNQLSPEKRGALNTMTVQLRKDHDVKAGVVDFATESLIKLFRHGRL